MISGFLKIILTRLIPDSWYTTKMICDTVTKLCNTIVELRWFVFPSLVIVAIMLGISFISFCRWKMENIRLKTKEL
jgi:hypothetical protein